MHNIEWIDRNNNDFWDIIEELWNLKEEINENSDIETTAETYWIPYDVTKEYVSILKDFYAPNKIPNDFMDKRLEDQLWFDLWELGVTNSDGVFFYYIKKLCPNKYKDISLLILTMISNEWIWTTPWRLNIKYDKKIPINEIIQSIKKYWDSAYDILKFCSPFDWSYIKKAISQYNYGMNDNEIVWKMTEDEKKRHEEWLESHRSDSESRSMLTQFFENFVYEPESINLLNFLKENPQTLDNLWWKEIKSINLNLDSWINFAFRGIIEMVKSRSDINFPHLNDNATDEDKIQRKWQWKRIIKEYENMLRSYIARDFIDWNNTESKKQFDRIFFTRPIWDEVIDDGSLSSDWSQQFSWNEIYDYSFNEEKDSPDKKKLINTKMLSDIEEYVKEHPNEKILICIEQHGNPDGSSLNWWTKEDWLKLANLSENVKIWSVRCYFGTAFDNDNIYNQKSSVSWFSNLSTGNMTVNEAINNSLNKDLWFHEMEIYTRLNYPVSVSPLTESMEYTNWNTWETETWKIWLAQNNEWQGDNYDNNYA